VARRRLAQAAQTLRLSRDALALGRQAAPHEAWLTIGLQAASAGAIITQLLIIKLLASQIAAPKPFSNLLTTFGAVIVLLLVTALANSAMVVQTELRPVLSLRISSYALERLLRTSSSVPLAQLETAEFQDRLARAQEGGESRSIELSGAVQAIGSGLATTAGSVAAIFVLAPVLGPVLLLGALPLWAATSANVGLFRTFVTSFTADRRQRAYLMRVLTAKESAHEIRAYDAGEMFLSRFITVCGRLAQESRRLAQARVLRSTVAAVISTCLTGLCLVIVIYMIHAHDMTGATGVTVIAAIIFASRGVAGIALGTSSLRECSVFLQDYYELTAIKPPDLPARRPADTASAKTGPSRFCIEARELTFCYPTASMPSLADVSISLRQGEITALIGRNGSGKSSLAKLLCGLYSPASGVLTWDGVPVDAATLHERSTIVFQDFARYMMTARENIAVGSSGDSDRIAAMLASGDLPPLSEVIDDLPAGLDTLLGAYFSGGVDISSGQWQRIAIARSLLRGGQLIVLDEPGAFLDAVAERAVLTRAKQLARHSAVLLISQNLDNLDLVDKAYLMADGKIIDSLTPHDLLRSQDLYSRLVGP
jgi:ATP-binding cassette subfamily B protein